MLTEMAFPAQDLHLTRLQINGTVIESFNNKPHIQSDFKQTFGHDAHNLNNIVVSKHIWNRTS